MATSGTWFEKVKNAKVTFLNQDGKQKFHYLFSDGLEMAEEYDAKTRVLLTRKWKRKTTLGGDGSWEHEVGEPGTMPKITEELFESNTNPRFSRTDTLKSFQWRIRNLPYPLDVYQISIEDDQSAIVLRTTNKKYYKKFDIPDMKRLQLPLSKDALTLSHANNTLIISYEKPKEVLQFENALKQYLSTLKPLQEEPTDCKTT